MRVLKTWKELEMQPDETWIFIGDVHGEFERFQELLRVHTDYYNNGKCVIVLLGDFTVKGPDSRKMVEFMLSQDESRMHWVLGNHEILALTGMLNPTLLDRDNRAAVIRAELVPLHFDTEPDYLPRDIMKVDPRKHGGLCDPDQLIAIAQRGSLGLKIRIPSANRLLLCAHAGVLPSQDDSSHSVDELTEMKYASWPEGANSRNKFPGSQHWYKLWDTQEGDRNITVLYGHDAKRGLNLRKYTKGLDSGCCKGHQLSGLIMQWDTSQHDFSEHLVQVDCSSSKGPQ